MSKRVLALLAALLVACALTGCRQSASDLPTYDPSDWESAGMTVYFEARILELHDTQILVEPIPSDDSQMAFDRVLVNITMTNGKTITDFAVGDEIGILFDGKVAMSLPAQILSVYGFFQVN